MRAAFAEDLSGRQGDHHVNNQKNPHTFQLCLGSRGRGVRFPGTASRFWREFCGTAHLEKTLADLGLTLAHLVKVNVWLKDIKDLPEMERLFNNHFAKDEFPARMTATTEFIDADCLLMIDGIAYKANAGGHND
jgi:hypothetical protein